MMIRSRLRFLVIGNILLLLVAVLLFVWVFHISQNQQNRHHQIKSIQAGVINLNIVTQDLLNESLNGLEYEQWEIVYSNLGKKISGSQLQGVKTFSYLTNVYLSISQRFKIFWEAYVGCKPDVWPTGAKKNCNDLLARMRTQVRFSLNDLIVEVYKIEHVLDAQSKRQNILGGIFLILLFTMMSVFVVIFVLPIRRSVGIGLYKMLEASDRFRQGDFSYRVNNIPDDEMGMLADTYNRMALQREEDEAVIRESAIRYRNIFENAEVSIWNEDLSEVYELLEQLRNGSVKSIREYLYDNLDVAWDMASKVRVIQVNKYTLKLFGAKAEEEIIYNINKTFGSDTINVFIEVLCAIWEKKDTIRAEANYRSLDGRELSTIVSLRIPESADEFKSVAFSILDISEQKKTEQALRDSEKKLLAAQNVAKIGHYTLNLSTSAWVSSPGLDNIFGSDDNYKKDISGWIKIVHPDYRKQMLNYFEVDVLKNFQMFDKEYKIINLKTGDEKWVHGIGEFKLDVYNNPVEMFGTIQDITERIKTENEKDRLQRELQQVHKMEALGQLTGGVAHDFNNILAIILGYTDMLKARFSNELPDKALDYLDIINKASERARELVAQMLIFSRSGNEDAQSLNLVPLVIENIKMLKSILPSSISIELNYDKDLPKISMAPSKLHQLLLNLCVNAKDAMDGIGELGISLSRYSTNEIECCACHKRIKGEWVQLAVTDTGCGMNSETLDHLFEPFFTTKDIGKGTGMGLSVLHGIIDSHGGHVLVETELGKGTTFRLIFPQSIEQEVKISDALQVPGNLPYGRSKHVLVVDDEPELSSFVHDLLELHGYKVTSITDSQEALNHFNKELDKFDLLITDQTMPGITGIELIEKIRKLKSKFPVILCSGYSENIDKVKAEALGVCYLAKPVDADMLIQTAGDLLGLK